MPRPFTEHGKQPGKINHGRSIGSGAALDVAVAAGKLISHIAARIFRSLIKDQLSLMYQGRLLRICRLRFGCPGGLIQTAGSDQANNYERRSGDCR